MLVTKSWRWILSGVGTETLFVISFNITLYKHGYFAQVLSTFNLLLHNHHQVCSVKKELIILVYGLICSKTCFPFSLYININAMQCTVYFAAIAFY